MCKFCNKAHHQSFALKKAHYCVVSSRKLFSHYALHHDWKKYLHKHRNVFDITVGRKNLKNNVQSIIHLSHKFYASLPNVRVSWCQLSFLPSLLMPNKMQTAYQYHINRITETISECTIFHPKKKEKDWIEIFKKQRKKGEENRGKSSRKTVRQSYLQKYKLLSNANTIILVFLDYTYCHECLQKKLKKKQSEQKRMHKIAYLQWKSVFLCQGWCGVVDST